MIKKLFTLVLLSTISLTVAQEKNSLLWKISGNGLKKDSYLFGTMHVSEKIAFHLDDVFFESIMKSDFVALESDPDLWLDNIFDDDEVYGQFSMFNSTRGNNFYNAPFELKEPKQQEVMFFISRDDILLNGVLYRTNQMKQNFQEETYLDMFIYQTGRKFGKKIFSLEDIKRSSYLVKKASGDPMKEKPDLWLQKRFKEENFYQLMNNAYRDRNIFLLDSLNSGMYNKSYLENMLYIRNEEMADNIDKIVRTGSLFSAIGAAHLAGEKGVINMLREKGYTVTPLLSEETEKGKTIKTSIEEKTIDTKYLPQTSSDGFFTANVPNKLYELTILNNTSYLCPDLANGSFVSITRINTFDYLHQEKENTMDFDKILIESIPGEIISKKEIEKQGFKGLDILNKTKTGNFQRYQIFFTPLEMLIFKMGGKKDFVKQFGAQFFDSIHFNNVGYEWVKVSPTHGGFEVEVPKYHAFTNKENYGNRLLQSIDEEGNYYFVREVILNDINYIEEDSFELERIQERFYKNLELEYEGGTFSDDKNTFMSKAKLKTKEDQFLYLKTYTKAGHYYLLGYLSKKEEPNMYFFDSFKSKEFKYKEDDFQVQKDTSLYFSVKSTAKPTFKNYYTKYDKKRNKSYKSFIRRASYISKGNEEVFVKLRKKHDFTSYANIDSLWSDVTYKKWFNRYSSYRPGRSSRLGNFSNSRGFSVVKKEKGKDKKGYDYYSYMLKDSLSSKAVLVKNILANGTVYELKTLIDTTQNVSSFIRNFYETFTPKDSVIGTSLFKDKTGLFFKALKNKDSIALDGYSYVNFDKKDAKAIMKIIRSYQFADDQLKIKEHLIKKLGSFKSKNVQRFLEDLYAKSFENPYNQLAILKSLGNERTSDAYQKVLGLLESDIPLTSNSYDVSRLINNLGDSLQLSRRLFPDLLAYANIREYKKPIYKLLSDILEKDLIKSQDYMQFKKQILTEAKIELKRQLSKKIKNGTSNTGYASYGKSGYGEGNLLNIYVKLLYPFRGDKNVQGFLSNLALTDNYYVKSTYLTLALKNNDRYNKKIVSDLTGEINSRGVLYKKLDKIGKTEVFPKEFRSKEEIYKAILFKDSPMKKLKDSLVFIKRKEFKKGEHTYEVFFYKTKPHVNSNSYNKDWKLSYICFKKEDDTIFVDHYHKATNEELDETKPIDEILDISVEKIRLKGRERVNLSSSKGRGFF